MGFTAIVPIVALTLALATMTSVGAQVPEETGDLLARVGERVAAFYRQARNVICLERSTVQSIDLTYSTVGFSRTVESELRIEAASGETADEASVVRSVRKVNGRLPTERDKTGRDGCTDPDPLSTEPLAFLLPSRRAEYGFKVAGVRNERNRPAMVIDFWSINSRSTPQLIEAASGHADCFDWSGHIASRGRVWVDAASYDVLRVERGLRGPVDVPVPPLIQRRHHLDNRVVIIRDEMTIRYRTVAFSEPQEVLLLPESINTLTIVRGGLQSSRRSQTYSDYRRFVTGGRVVP